MSPAWVRSRIRSRSNSARAPKTWKTSLPPLVVVSSCSCRDLKPMPRSCRRETVSMRWRSERPRGGVGEGPLAARLGQGVLLEGEGLLQGGDAGVADEHGVQGSSPETSPLEDRQLAGLPLLLSPVVQPEHRLVPHPGQQEDLLDLRGGGHPAQLVVQGHSDLGLQQPLLLLRGCHIKIYCLKTQ